MATGSENTTNRVYISSPEFGWLPAKLKESPTLTSTVTNKANEKKKVRVEIRDYENDHSIPACEVSNSINPTLAQKRRGDRSVPIKEIEIDLSTYKGAVLPLQNVDEDGKLIEVEDMVDLSFLHEAAILYNLKSRHTKGIPYTRTGDIVIAVNPYQWITDLYADHTRNLYAEKLVWNVSNDSDPRSHIAPHVYEVSSLAYRGLAVDSQNQSILVSGESGAGKTETVKILMSHLATVQNGHSATNAQKSDIVQRVLDSNPLLEAFGNAKTVRNDNSSRFGKFIQLQFDAEDAAHAAFAGKTMPSAVLAGSKCEVYLLEKSRVISHEPEERTYHIFYQLLAAPEEKKIKIWKGLENTDNESFTFVGYSDTDTIEGLTDAQRFEETEKALSLVGVKDEKFLELMRALCIVLQLGNLIFDVDPENDENSIISSTEELISLAELMGVEEEDIRKALTERTVTARNEVYKVPLNVVRARDSCDALAKAIYNNTFDWLVETINEATCAENNYNDNPKADFSLIGLLDIFGFESFTVNRFEQLCINYANEKLQQKFTIDIFRSVQQEYEFEGIELGEVTFNDNADVLDLIEGRMGLISVLNEECVRPKGNDNAFVAKIYTMNKDAECLYKGRFFHEWEFGIKHYAGDVTYDANNFVTKNMDNLASDLTDCRKKSTNEIVSNDVVRISIRGRRPKSPKSASTTSKAPARAKKDRVLLNQKSSSIISDTVWTKFRSQLGDLMHNIGETRTRYIRCIKPNQVKEPLYMQHLSTVEQLRCAGVVAAVTISRSAFPNRLELEVVLDRFMCLNKSFHKESNGNADLDLLKSDVNRLLSSILKDLEIQSEDGKTTQGFVCGKTRAYFRAGSLEHLENKRLSAFGHLAKDIQRIVRGFVKRNQYLRLRKNAIRIQTNARLVSARRKYLAMRRASILIQCFVRAVAASMSLAELRRNHRATKIQSRWRVVMALTRFKVYKQAAIKIQACARGARQRPIYRKELAESIEAAKLENQLKILQQKLEEAEAKRIEAEKKAEEQPKTVIVYKEAEGASENKDTEIKDSPSRVKSVAAPSVNPTVAQLSIQQQTLMDESGKMLEYLRKEVFKLRSQNSQMRTDMDLLKENNQRLLDANASAGASFAALNQHAKQLTKTNAKLQADVLKYKEQAHTSHLANMELKEELKMKQSTYISEVHSRLQYQKAMTKIVDLVQDRSRDHRLVEDILDIADECETDYMQGPTGVDLAPHHNQSSNQSSDNARPGTSTSLTSRFRSFFG